MRLRPLLLLALALCGCALRSPPAPPAPPQPFALFDGARQRPIDVLLYGAATRPKPLAVISHGYGGHAGSYRFLAETLVARGYLVAAIEHAERPGDPPMVNQGDLARLRRPVWQVGADSIGFVVAELTRRRLARAGVKPVLIGHSNGGDMTMLYATEHPEAVDVALTLDNRRMPLPRTRSPKICSVRSNDLPADPGVLPSAEEQRALDMVIVPSPVRHDDMGDSASPEGRRAILDGVAACLGRSFEEPS